MLAEPPLSTGFNLKPHVAQPRSEGTVELASPDPREKPRIDPKYLSDSVRSPLHSLMKFLASVVSMEQPFECDGNGTLLVAIDKSYFKV